MRKPKFETLVGKDGKIYFHLKASNGEIILAGRGHKTKPEAIHAIASVMRYATQDRYVVRRDSANEQFFFQVKSPSGRILAWSEMYHTLHGRETGIHSVQNAVQYGRVLELN